MKKVIDIQYVRTFFEEVIKKKPLRKSILFENGKREWPYGAILVGTVPPEREEAFKEAIGELYWELLCLSKNKGQGQKEWNLLG